MTRIGAAYGASPLTFLSLGTYSRRSGVLGTELTLHPQAGVGDLFLTCSSSNSRNYTVGYRLGKGEKLEEIIKTLGSVAEGVSTAKGLYEIVQELGVNAPIATAVSIADPLRLYKSSLESQVYGCLYEGKLTSEKSRATILKTMSRFRERRPRNSSFADVSSFHEVGWSCTQFALLR
jgi:hypothetical protein